MKELISSFQALKLLYPNLDEVELREFLTKTSETNIDLIYTDLKDSNKSLDSSLEKIDLFQNIEQSEMIEILRSIVIDLYLISNDQQKLIDHLISQRK